MNKPRRWATNDKVEITDTDSPYFGKTGTLIEIRSVPTEMINRSSKTISSKMEYRYVVKLDETETIKVFTLCQLRKISLD